jgi:integrase
MFPQSHERDLATLVVPRIGCVAVTDDPLEPYRLVDADGGVVAPVASFLRELLAASRAPLTLRSYAMDLLRWWRFLAAVDVRWERATPVEGRDFSLWIRQASKPRSGPVRGAAVVARAGGADRRRRPQSRREGLAGGIPGQVNPVTGKPSPGWGYAPRTVNHSETVLRTFYDFHREAGSGPMVNPFPLDRARRGGRSHAHHNPLDPWPRDREGRYRSTVAQRPPRGIPDEMFELLFAALPSHRDRALVAFWISAGARASELLGACQGDADPGQQMITVVRKGSRRFSRCPPRRTRSSGCVFTSSRCTAGYPRGGGSPCGGRCASRWLPCPITRRTGCSSGPTRCSARTGRCTTCGIRPRTGWPATPRSRWLMSSGSWAMRT